MTKYLESHRTGELIKAHRTALGVSFPELLRAAGPGMDEAFRFVEKAQRPAIEMIETHHAALMAAYVGAADAHLVPLARREQWYATSQDAVLWQLAMESNPRISWWWGVRHHDAPRGAWCHLCGSVIHRYDVGRGMTSRARKAVMRHRLEHIEELTAAPAASNEKKAK